MKTPGLHPAPSVTAPAKPNDEEITAGTGHDAWISLRTHTAARIAIGRQGVSLPTEQVLAFDLAHAQARDAVLTPLDVEALTTALHQAHWPTLQVCSQAPNRAAYLARPDWGRRLSAASQRSLAAWRAPEETSDLCIVIGDGLSSTAITHTPAFLTALRPYLDGLRLTPVVIATQARVALGDDIGAALGSRLVVVLIGERPGLSAADSLSAYITFAPQRGRSDAERNCISNIRPAGLPLADGARQLAQLIQFALAHQRTGVSLPPSAPPSQKILLDSPS